MPEEMEEDDEGGGEHLVRTHHPLYTTHQY